MGLARFFCLSVLAIAFLPFKASGFVLSFSNANFSSLTPTFSDVTTFNFEIEITDPFVPGAVYADPAISQIEYNVNGSLDTTPSMFPAFGFQLSHINTGAPAPPESIPGAQFYGLNASALPGATLLFKIGLGADLSNGLQVDELETLAPNAAAGIGSDVIFHFNGREEGTGRYHPLFLQLRNDGTGILQNADNMGGVNPVTLQEVDVDFGEEYITDLGFDAGAFTIGAGIVPEPTRGLLGMVGFFTFC